MSELMRLDEEYRNWIQELGDRYRTSQIKASIRVNNEMLMYYWSVGKDIVIVPQVGERLLKNNGNQIVPQVEEQFEMASNKVFMIPWGHIKLLIDKCHDNSEKFDFYVNKVIENNWSRAVLLNFLETDLYERQGQAITNFQYTLPKGTGDLAQEITKDPYNFDFV